MPSRTENSKPLTNREKQLIRFLRQLEWGEVRVRVENGQPVLIYEAIKTLRLGEKDTTPPSPGNKIIR
ncbi:transketolase [Desulfallas thermosapovorans]|uniref:Uncharacterized protein n=1 Tax=Desulfallas thermosapovorans DSM 6562 TaxID=1121431 RepID=A0A5S4ZT19_9FIRM|nr:transketolase [Desulfallas thermosapovorans]TYO95931.1 hypothetical protein LX24_01321 [Desulfallas thermosapovorans DSM 6562]